MSVGDGCKRALGALGLCVVTSCENADPQIDIPAPIPIAQWAERVDTLAGTYSMLDTPIEFGDSIVVVVDVRERTVYKINLRSSEQTQLGSKGDGPGEYRSPGTPVKVRGDSVALLRGHSVDPIPIISVVTGRGRTHRIPLQGEKLRGKALVLSNTKPWLLWADTVGNVYGNAYDKRAKQDTSSDESMLPKFEPLDTFPVVRYGLFTGKIDTLFIMPRGVDRIPTTRDANGSTTSGMELGPYGTFNSWYPMLDGRLLVANASIGSVKILEAADGASKDLTIQSNAIPVSKQGWDAYVSKKTAGHPVEMEKFQAETYRKMGAVPIKSAREKFIVPDRPSVLPRMNFQEGRYHMYAVGNTMWVPVHVSDPPGAAFWDLIDMTKGARLQTLSIPDKQILTAVTPLGAYVVAIDDDDVQRILLYRRKSAN